MSRVSRNPARRVLKDAPRWIFLAALIYAPWAYGCTTTRTLLGLLWILDVAFSLWIIDRFVAKQWPRTPSILAFSSLAVLIIGWWMVLNSRWIYDSEYYLFIPVRRLLGVGPGTLDQAVSAAWMMRATALLLVVWFVADLSQRPVWLLRLWWTIGIAGGSIALLGLLEKATGAAMIFWQPTPSPVGTFFATYYYHANAGAFLNLVLAPTWGLTLRTFTKPTHPAIRALWLGVLVILLVGTFSDTSRMAQLIAVILIVALAAGSSRPVMQRLVNTERRYLIIGAVVMAVTLFAVAQASHLDQPLRRWQQTSAELCTNGRWIASRAALHAIPDVGLFGFGPGTFRIIFPYYTGDLGTGISNVWQYLHEDYLQTLLEWGWVGSFLWAVILFGGIAMAVRKLRSLGSKEWSPRYRALLWLSLLSLGGVLIHALVDFPLQIASLQLYTAMYVGICWGSSGWGKESKIIKDAHGC